MKKRRRKMKKLPILILIVIVLYGGYLITAKSIKQTAETRLANYLPEIKDELEKNELDADEFAPVLLAIMDQESHGKGSDPMQSSESAGLARNEIGDPAESIKQGVYHFSEMYKYGEANDVDLETIIQSYNMGPGYIDFVVNSDTFHSEETAKSYSELMVEKSPDLYTCNNDKLNFRYPYCYGDYSYAGKVTAKIDAMNKLVRQHL